MRRLLLIPLLLILPACGSTRTVTSSSGSDNKLQLDNEALRRAVDAFADRLVQRVSAMGEEAERQVGTTFIRRRALLWRLRAAQLSFQAQHSPNTLIALTSLWYWTASVAHHIETGHVPVDLGELAPKVVASALALRDEAELLASRALPPDIFAKLKTDIGSSVSKGDAFSVDSADNPALMDQFLSVTHLEKLLSLPLAPFELFSGVGDSGKALGRMAVSADRAIDLAEKYPQILQWRMSLLLLDFDNLETLKTLRANIQRVADLAEQLPVQMRVQVQTLLEESRPVQAEVQHTLQEATATSVAVTALLQEARGTMADLDRFLAGFRKPEDPSKPTTPPGEPFRIADYTATATAATELLHELRATLADLQQPALAGRTQEAIDTAVARAQQSADATVDRIAWRAVQVIGVAFLAGLALILVARWKRA